MNGLPTQSKEYRQRPKRSSNYRSENVGPSPPVPWKNKRKKRNAKKRVARKEQRSSAVLLIDEADALLGKRTKVKDAFGGKADMTVCGGPLSRSLSGVKRTCAFALHISAFDPKRTWTRPLTI